MEGIIHAMLENDVSYEQFLRFVTDYDIQEDPYIREVLNQLLTEESNTRSWTVQYADDLLDMLKSPEKTQPRPPLKQIEGNDQSNTHTEGLACDQCHKTFKHKQDLNRHVKSTHQKITFSCSKCDKTFTRHSNLKRHNAVCRGDLKFPCDQCREVFKASRELEFHKKLVHKAVKNKHIAEVHSVNPRAYSEGIIRNPKTYTKGFACDQCHKIFKHKQDLNMHVKSAHQKITFSCSKCDKTFTRQSNLNQHDTVCRGIVTFPCNQCTEILKTSRELKFHQKLKHKAVKNRLSTAVQGSSTYNCKQCDAKFQHPKQLQVHNARQHKGRLSTSPRPGPSSSNSPRPGPSSYKCHRCPAQFPDRQKLISHGIENHYQMGGGMHPMPFPQGQEPWINADQSVNEGLRDCYMTNRPLILERFREGPVESLYNIPMFPGMRIWDIGQALQGIYDRQRHAFKVNLAFGFIMRHVETEQYRYFRPFDNVNIFDAPILISRRSDIGKILKRLKEMDIMAEMAKNRPNTKYKLELLTNIRVKCYNTNFTLGAAKQLPVYITRCKSIISLNKDPLSPKPYEDNLCLFRCLSLHRHGSLDRVQNMLNEWQSRYTEGGNINLVSPFSGVQLSELPEFEQCFGINVQMYSLEEDGAVVPVFKSTERYEDTMYVNQYENHCSYITDFKQYAKKFRCELCDKMFSVPQNFKKHSKICDKKTEFEYPGGFYKEQTTVFDQLEDLGIYVPEDQRTFPWFAVFDFESMLIPIQGEATEKMEWTQHHVPISVSVCSNIPGFTDPKCLVNPDKDQLLGEMAEELSNIQVSCEALAEQKWGSYLAELENKMQEETDPESVMTQAALKNVYGKLKSYLSQMPVLGFNSAKYDINLVKQKLLKHLSMHDQPHGFVVKKSNAYACISTNKYRILDILNFLSPSTSYSKFLKAYNVEECKGFFPYEWLNDVTKLEQTTLPSHDQFYSSLKESNISTADYKYCQKIWTNRGMTAFRDFLVWYNNLDVKPFVTAVERLQKFYFDKSIDIFKTAMSVPGIARQLLFKAARERGAEFALIDKKNADLYDTIKDNIVGGPSIIFTRYHKADETKIRGGKPCKKVVGFDANALYLWAIGQAMPEGTFVRRRAENDFRPEHRDQYMQAFNWLNYLNQYEGTHIRHQRNNVQEVRIDQYPVDGYDPKTNTVYEFQGCYHHGHVCDVTKNVTNEKWLKTKDDLMTRTQKKVAQLREEGYTVVEMWECQFRQFCKEHPLIYKIRDQCRPTFSQKHWGKVTEKQILNAVRTKQLFGMVECDISVPDEWGPEFQHMRMTPRKYFEEMCPIFCNTGVGFDDIGEHMQAHIWKYQLSDKPRRLLVGGYAARQILLATPLLKCYLDHGLKVTKIYQVVEYRKMACFDSFVQSVSNARRAGDASPNQAIIADTMKLIGNSGYGSLIMDKGKHRHVYYVQGENRACFEVNKPRFRQSTCLDLEDQYHEIEAAKPKIRLDLPTQLGFFILQYAKLCMLQFYYDVIDRYVDRSDFEYIEMDTDSAYMALSASSLGEVIKPEHLAEYQRGLTGMCDDKYNHVGDRWFPRECCEKHARWDSRCPGLFKVEMTGDEMIGLCSKTYIVSRTVPSKATSAIAKAANLLRKARGQKPQKLRSLFVKEYKFSSKGVSKRLVKEPFKIFKKVLRTGKPASGNNKGFRVRNNGICSYQQTRYGFSYFYCKRKVLNDGVNTIPLDIVLCPKRAKQAPEKDLLDELSDEQLLALLE